MSSSSSFDNMADDTGSSAKFFFQQRSNACNGNKATAAAASASRSSSSKNKKMISVSLFWGVPCINNVNSWSLNKINVGSQQSHAGRNMPLKLERSILSARQVDADSLHRRHGPHAMWLHFDGGRNCRRRAAEARLALPQFNLEDCGWVNMVNKDSEMINVTYQVIL
jgi:hypothetical protein